MVPEYHGVCKRHRLSLQVYLHCKRRLMGRSLWISWVHWEVSLLCINCRIILHTSYSHTNFTTASSNRSETFLKMCFEKKSGRLNTTDRQIFHRVECAALVVIDPQCLGQRRFQFLCACLWLCTCGSIECPVFGSPCFNTRMQDVQSSQTDTLGARRWWRTTMIACFAKRFGPPQDHEGIRERGDRNYSCGLWEV